MLECNMKKTYEQIGCMPWFLPQRKNISICGPWKTMKFSDLMAQNSSQDDCPNCLPDCEKIEYTVSTTEAEIRSCSSRNFNQNPLCSTYNINGILFVSAKLEKGFIFISIKVHYFGPKMQKIFIIGLMGHQAT